MINQSAAHISGRLALTGASVFDGQDLHNSTSVLIEDGHILGQVDPTAIPDDYQVLNLNGGFILPGLVDLQVNGGGDIMFNDAPSTTTIAQICEAHARLGTTSLLPTFITDTREKTDLAIAAAITACKTVPGCIGLHLEGPHLDPKRAGAHNPNLIRPMENSDLDQLLAAKAQLPILLMTLAPEAVQIDQVKALSDAGIVLSLGHSDTDYETALRYAEAGVNMVTHLFNAMSGLDHRAPGLSGAAIGHGDFHAGIIADGHHVHQTMLRLALDAKTYPGGLFLVSDAMATTGGTKDHFQLNGRTVRLRQGRLTLEDGTLAGAHGSLLDMLRYANKYVAQSPEQGLSLATSAPAKAILQPHLGQLDPGTAADLLHLSEDLELRGVWRNGVRLS